MKIKEYPIRSTELDANNVFLIDGDAGTQIVKPGMMTLSTSEIDASVV